MSQQINRIKQRIKTVNGGFKSNQRDETCLKCKTQKMEE